MLLHAFDKLFLIVTFGSSDLCLCFCVAVYTQYVRMCVHVKYKCAVDESIGFRKHNYKKMKLII